MPRTTQDDPEAAPTTVQETAQDDSKRHQYDPEMASRMPRNDLRQRQGGPKGTPGRPGTGQDGGGWGREGDIGERKKGVGRRGAFELTLRNGATCNKTIIVILIRA